MLIQAIAIIRHLEIRQTPNDAKVVDKPVLEAFGYTQ